MGKNVPFMQCAAARQKRFAENSQMQLRISKFECIQKIIDEKEKSAAVWFDAGFDDNELQVRVADRLSFNDDGKITAYHMIYDTYALRLQNTSLMAKEGLSLGMVASFAFALLGAGTLAAAFVKRRTDKAYSPLENEVCRLYFHSCDTAFEVCAGTSCSFVDAQPISSTH